MKKIICILIIVFIFFTSCSLLLSILQPDTAHINSVFDVPITIELDPVGDSDVGSTYWGKVGYLAIQLPSGWSVEDSIPYSGIRDGFFKYSKIIADSMAMLIKPNSGYYWWAAVSDSIDALPDGQITVTPKVHTGNNAGLYFLDYYIAKRLDKLSNRYQVVSKRNPISIDLPMQAVVTNTKDSGAGSLRNALTSVGNGGEITFDLSYPATIVLDSQLVVRHKVTINGPADGDLVISGNDSTRIFYVDQKAQAEIKNISLTHGISMYEPDLGYAGSAFFCRGRLKLDRVCIYRNKGSVVYIAFNAWFDINNSAGNFYANKCSIVNNKGIEIYREIPGEASVVNSILWGNEDTTNVRAYYSLSGGENWAMEEGAPVFADTANDNYRLLEGSPGIDAGIQDAPVIIDGDTLLVVPPMAYLGDAPDMGAYEFDPATAITDIEKTPARYSLYQNYPNPFNPETMINYQLPMTSYVELTVFNVLGQKVTTLVSGKQIAGTHQVKFNATGLASGIYYYMLKTGKLISYRKMILLK